MSGKRITKLQTLTSASLSPDDVFAVVDVSDTNNSTGVTKRITYSELTKAFTDRVNVVVNNEFVQDNIYILSQSIVGMINNLPTGGGGVASQQCFESSVGQMVFDLNPSVTVPNTLTYVNGVLLTNNDYTVTTSSVTLDFTVPESSSVCVVDYGQTYSISDFISSYGYETKSVVIEIEGVPTSGSILFKPD